MRRLVYLLAMVAAIMMVALPAMAQAVEDGGDSGAAISVTATVVFVSGAIAYIVEFVRGRLPGLDGDVVRALSVVLAVGAVLAWDLRIAADYGYAGLPDALDIAASALIIAGLGGAIASWKNSKRAQDPSSSLSNTSTSDS